MNRILKSIDNSWTLFLDRDGVINHEIKDGYVLNWSEFVFYDDILKSLAQLASCFKYIFVVTNQRGVGKGLMSLKDLNTIHQKMQQSIELAGGRIDGIYFCTDLDADSPCRKPNTGMALQAKQEHADIDFSKSVMVGNSPGDMEFGRAIGAFNIFISTTKQMDAADERVDMFYPTLPDFAEALYSLR